MFDAEVMKAEPAGIKAKASLPNLGTVSVTTTLAALALLGT